MSYFVYALILISFVKIGIGKNVDLNTKPVAIIPHIEMADSLTTFGIATFDSLQHLKDSMRMVENENTNLKYEIENLKSEIGYLNGQIEKYDVSYTIPPLLFFTIILVFILLSSIVFLFFYNGGAHQIKSLFMEKNLVQGESLTKTAPLIPITSVSTKRHVTKIEVSNAPKSFSNISRRSHKKSEAGNDWFVVCASSIGKSHITSNIPCQDNHYCENIGYGWGIAISCDGAGSAENSDLGSVFVSKEAFNLFKKYIISNSYHKKNFLPSDNDWNIFACDAFNQIRRQLEKFAKSKKIEFTSVGCTVIVVIYSPIGLLVVHIGDGRSGYCNIKGEWNSMLTPHKGEESNETIFISSNGWQNGNSFSMSGVSVPECRVIREKPSAFTLLSDGCEAHSFECSKMDTSTNKWHDPNIPFSKFFDPLVKSIKGMYQNSVPFATIDSKWRTFIEEGTLGLKEEADDKTLIVGVLM